MNIELLKKVRDNLTDENYDQEKWCGTACCIAGHACLLEGWEPISDIHYKKGDRIKNVSMLAQELLGLDGIQAGKLFHAGYWPDQFYSDFVHPTAQVGKDRIDHFIKTNGEE